MAIESYEDLAEFLQENGEYSKKAKKLDRKYNHKSNYDYIVDHLTSLDYLLNAIKALQKITEFNLDYWEKMRDSWGYRCALSKLDENGLLDDTSLAQIGESKNLQSAVALLGENNLLNKDNYEDLLESESLRQTLATLCKADVMLNLLNQDSFAELKKPRLQHTVSALNTVGKLNSSVLKRILKKPEEQKKLLISSDEEFARKLQQQELKGSKYKSVEQFVGAELLFYEKAHKGGIKPPVLENIDHAPEIL
ncbi:hypothetical protein [Piscirickettsia salmonis]|uniref:hypothetical protein n=1 Tax=Piscirickettsia salmonis TaxID=1238 RepID=UPI0007C952BE|nr:hypothetical protein A0O36_00763 [Piscirickettsiaceae bacterium NZ-RLO1]